MVVLLIKETVEILFHILTILLNRRYNRVH